MAAERNSDGSYDAVDSGGFGKDYHGQDAFGERIGGTGTGGSHFGGFEEGHFGVDDGRNHFERKATSYGDIAQTETMDKPDIGSSFDGSNESEAEASSGMRDTLRDLNSESSEENSNVGSLDTSFQIGGTEDEERTKAKAELDRKERELIEAGKRSEAMSMFINEQLDKFAKEAEEVENMGFLDKTKDTVFGGKRSNLRQKIESFAAANGVELDDKIRMGMTTAGKEREAIKAALEKISKETKSKLEADLEAIQTEYDTVRAEYGKLESSFTDKMKEDKPKETNMSKATPGKSDYETKANKGSTKELPKERNDFGNHAMDTLKGVTDKITGSLTKDALGLKSIEDFARENGYNPEKLSTMKAYQSYQNKEIMKAIPSVMKKVGGYIVERIKDAFDPSQLPERVRNTLARYNAATLVGAAILSINSGAGLQASIDQALTMVDPEDQTAVSDFLEDVLKDRDTVKDLSNAIDGALAPEENSATRELDEEIVNIGRKNNTDYDDFNAGLGTTTSDADVKVFIARNIKADPILRRMVEKLGK